MRLRGKLRTFLKQHPNINPYRFSFDASFRYMTNSLRYLPHFLIIGGSKSGKWTVQSYLRQHPQISSGTEKPYMLYWFDLLLKLILLVGIVHIFHLNLQKK